MTLHNLSKTPRPEPSTLSLVYKSYKKPRYAYDRCFQQPRMAELYMGKHYGPVCETRKQSRRAKMRRDRLLRLRLRCFEKPSMEELRKNHRTFSGTTGSVYRIMRNDNSQHRAFSNTGRGLQHVKKRVVA